MKVNEAGSLDFLPKAYFEFLVDVNFGMPPNGWIWWGVFQVLFKKDCVPPPVEKFAVVENTSGRNYFYKYLPIDTVIIEPGPFPAVFSDAEVSKPPVGEWYHTSCHGPVRAEICDAYETLKNLPDVEEVWVCGGIPDTNFRLVFRSNR